MAETLDHDPQALIEEPDETLRNAPTEDSPAERDAREATELQKLRRQYSRASTFHQGSSIASKKPETLLERFTYGVSKFWRHQISVTVPHVTCRDHLGMFQEHLSSPVQHFHTESDSALWFFPIWDRNYSPENPFMQLVIWYFSNVLSQKHCSFCSKHCHFRDAKAHLSSFIRLGASTGQHTVLSFIFDEICIEEITDIYG